MNADHARYADWDAAYVLGALAPGERREYEDHLADCGDCRRAVAELTPTVGLLSRLSADDAARIDDGPDATTRAGLVSLAHGRAHRRRRTGWIVGVAAAAIVVAAVAVPLSLSAAAARPVASFALSATADVPLEADVRLTSVGWGTRIDLDCRYPDVYVADVPEGGWTYALAVVGTDGSETTVSTWRAGPGTSARLGAGTALDVEAIRAVEIRSAKGVVLMRYELSGSD